MSTETPTFGFWKYVVCYMFASLCAFTMKDLLTRTFLVGLLPDSCIPFGVASAAFLGFLFQVRWLIWEAPDIPKATYCFQRKPH